MANFCNFEVRVKGTRGNSMKTNLRNTSSSVRDTPPSTVPSNPAPATTPSKKKEGCYIATTVYGSYNAPEVLVLRRFRDETLQKTALGRWFIRTYYRWSPSVAKKVPECQMFESYGT